MPLPKTLTDNVMNETVRAVYGEVERACAAPSNAFGPGIWTHHILSVRQFGRELSKLTGADAEIVELAALLHDYAGIKDVRLGAEHHLYGAALARELLRALDYPETRIEQVAACILTHRASQSLVPATLEARVLASADAAAHIAQVPSLLYLAYFRKGLGVDEGVAWVRAKLARSYHKLMPEAKPLVDARYQMALSLLELGR